jgi:hypothetical protein
MTTTMTAAQIADKNSQVETALIAKLDSLRDQQSEINKEVKAGNRSRYEALKSLKAEIEAVRQQLWALEQEEVEAELNNIDATVKATAEITRY